MADIRSLDVTAVLQGYAVAHGSTTPDLALDELRTATTTLGSVARMQIGPDEGQMLTWLTALVGARVAVEVGTFTGYSSISIARGLAPGGRLLCCDVSEEWTALAREAWAAAGVADRIELRLAPALDTLRALPTDAHIDLAFIDADKGGYAAYWDELVPRMRPGGVVAVDNVLWGGAVVDPDEASEDTAAIRAFNDKVASDDRVDAIVLPAFDGLTLARRL